ncbi:MAG: TRAP transporter substrate-binding protein DctP [Planctomycetota bacterium]
MKKLFSTAVLPPVALVAAILGSAAALRADDDEKITIKIATQAPKGTVWMNALEALNKEIKEKAKVEFVFFHGGSMGTEAEVARKIQERTLGGGLFTGIGLGDVLPEARILELPFFYETTEEIDLVKKELEPDMQKHFEEKGYVFLGWAEVGWAYIFSKEESKGLADLKKRKIWLWSGDPLAEATFKEFGLAGTPLSLADVLPSLESGMIDSVYNSPYGLIGLQWHSKVKFMSRMSVGHGTGALLIGKKEWEKIPAKKRDKVAKIARTHLDKLVVDIRAKNEASVVELEKNGVKVIPIPTDEIDDYKKRGRAVADAMAAENEEARKSKNLLYTKDWLDRVKTIVEKARKK